MQKKSQQGVTLFEMLLVLMITALVAVAAIRYADRQRDEAVADRLAEKLYFYSQAVREYAFDNQEAIEAGTITMTQLGVDWLKEAEAGLNETGEPYLNDDFTFAQGMEPLFLGEFDGTVGVQNNPDEDIVQTELSWNATEDRPEIEVLIGSLYDPNTGSDSQGVRYPPQVMPDISATAAQKASEFYDPHKGFAALTYQVDITDPSFPNVPIVGNLSHTSTESEDYLRIDGQNYMKDFIDFIDADVHGNVTEAQDDYGIRYIETIAFDDNATNSKISKLRTLDFHDEALNSTATNTTKVNNLDVLNFKNNQSANSGILNNAYKINFKRIPVGVGGSPSSPSLIYAGGEINNLQTLNFAAVSTLTQINNLNEINLTANRKINTMEMRVCKGISDGKYFLTKRNEGSACFLIKDADSADCEIIRNTGNAGGAGIFYLGQVANNDGGKCAFGCLVWNASAVGSNFCTTTTTSNTPLTNGAWY